MDLTFPRLYSHAIDKLQSVQQFLSSDNWISFFQYPLYIEAFSEFQNLHTLLSDMTLSTDDDKWECTLGKAGFKPYLVCKQHYNHIDKHAPSCWIWKSKCQSKHKFFAWLLLHDRINTKDMLLRIKW